LAHGFFELNILAFVEGFKTIPLNFRKMHEQILPVFGFNKTITFAFVKPLYFTYWHKNTPFVTIGKAYSGFSRRVALPVLTGVVSLEGFLQATWGQKKTNHKVGWSVKKKSLVILSLDRGHNDPLLNDF
jgi:hypothetical protein